MISISAAGRVFNVIAVVQSIAYSKLNNIYTSDAGDEHLNTKFSVYPAGLSYLTVMDHGVPIDITMLVPVKEVDPVLSSNSQEVGSGQRDGGLAADP